ncbi:hypothetical protein PROVRETT_07606 [Providencia rettgeri DSM 1131]|nr:hypothetical protein PROVRETT_07606 [Providencia rettgeri DSM 1131]
MNTKSKTSGSFLVSIIVVLLATEENKNKNTADMTVKTDCMDKFIAEFLGEVNKNITTPISLFRQLFQIRLLCIINKHFLN